MRASSPETARRVLLQLEAGATLMRQECPTPLPSRHTCHDVLGAKAFRLGLYAGGWRQRAAGARHCRPLFPLEAMPSVPRARAAEDPSPKTP